MIYVTIQTHKEIVKSMNVKGHAMFSNYGKDIVCAGVSAIVIGLCNALDLLCDKSDVIIGDNSISININDDYKQQIIVKTAIIQLETIAESYKKNINIEKQEV